MESKLSDSRLAGDKLSFLFNANKGIIFLILAALYILDTIIRNNFVITEELYFSTFVDQFTYEQISADYTDMRAASWLGYLSVVIFLVVRIFFAAFCLNAGALFTGRQLGFGKMIGIALGAEFIFVLMSFVNTGMLMIVQPESLTQLSTFQPFSVLAFFQGKPLPIYTLYPLQTINLFEICYWFVLAMGLQSFDRAPYWVSFRRVMASYGIGLLFWVVTVMFIMTFNY